MKYALIISLLCVVQLHAQTVDSITESLTQNIVNDSQKVVRIYDWITKNIKYEQRSVHQNAELDTTLRQEPYNVIVRKKAVCMGYAKLVKAMCYSAGIEAVVIEGMAKNVYGALERNEHAWNAVRINNNWYLLDATWDSGSFATAKQYFLTTPSVFIETHYPHDPMWQLLDKIKLFSCFVNKKDCFKEDKKPFYYQDSIAMWLKLDSLNQKRNSAERSLKYNANNIEAIRNMANTYSEEAYRTFEIYDKWRETTILKKETGIKPEEVFKWLDTIEYNLQQARLFYDRLVTFAQKGTFTDAQFNRDLMLENLLKLENERRFVIKYFKKQ
jgi:hypothetical protein